MFDLIVSIQRVFLKFNCFDRQIFLNQPKLPKELDLKDISFSGIDGLVNAVCSLRVFPEVFFTKGFEESESFGRLFLSKLNKI